MAAVVLLWSPILRNDATPAGDGARIMKFIAFARDVGGFALWNPYRNGGYPLAADPEHFWLLSLIVDPSSPHANLALNAAIFALILLSAVPTWLIGRKLRLEPFWNVLFVVAVCFNEHLIWMQLSGRVHALVFHAMLLVVIWNLLYSPPRPWNYLLISISIGIAFAMGGHFALVHCALVLSWFLFNDGAPWRRPLHRSLSAVGRAAAVSLAGFALSGAWSVPLVAHIAESHRITSALAYPPQAPDNVLAYARLFVAFVPAAIEYVSFLSLVLIPALLLARWARPAKVPPGARGFALIYFWGALFMLMSVPLVGTVVKTVYQTLPFVSGVRWFSPFEDVLRTAWLISAFAVFQTLERRRVDELDGTTRILIAAYLAVASAFAALQGIRADEPITAAAAAATAALAIYGLASSAGLRIAAFERTTFARLGAVLVILSSAMIAGEIWWQYFPGTNWPTHLTNERDMPRLETIVRSDREPYFRFISDTNWQLWFIDDEKRGTAAFSLYFPPSLARTMNFLSPRLDTNYLRPHWVKLVPCRDFDPRALDLLAIKYMFCRLDVGKLQVPPNWQAVESEESQQLFRNTAYNGGLRIFCKWRIGGPAWEREEVLSAFSGGVALVEAAAAHGLPEPGADCSDGPGRDVVVIEDRPGHMTLKVVSATPGIVFVPDNYDNGWRGTVNAIATPVVKVYGAYLGIPVAAGESTVTMEYRDQYFWLGVALSVVAMLGLCGYATFTRRETGCGTGNRFCGSAV